MEDLILNRRDKVYLCFEDPGGMGERVDFSVTRNGGLSIECNSDWAGCTETGFGESVSQFIGPEQVRELYAWLGEILAAEDGATSQ